jgi:hypothetical protein
MALGTISSLLLSAGLAKAALKLDPLTKSLGKVTTCSNESPTNSCTVPCMFQSE